MRPQRGEGMGIPPMQSEPVSNIYEIVLKYATFPVLFGVVVLACIITNIMMSTKWQQARRNKQIRKAVAARQALLAETDDANDVSATERPEKPAS